MIDEAVKEKQVVSKALLGGVIRHCKKDLADGVDVENIVVVTTQGGIPAITGYVWDKEIDNYTDDADTLWLFVLSLGKYWYAEPDKKGEPEGKADVRSD